MQNVNLQSIMRQAHEIKRTATMMFGEGVLFSLCLQIAWAVAKADNLKKLMQTNIVAFQYKKKDGTIRNAIGTLKADMLPPIEGSRRPNDSVCVYYDIEKQAFRCFIKENFIKVLNVI